eukprot:6960569-Prymnesium_polylepis.1
MRRLTAAPPPGLRATSPRSDDAHRGVRRRYLLARTARAALVALVGQRRPGRDHPQDDPRLF